MPNRIIKESICTSEEINKLSAESEILFYRLMVQCDDFGLFFAAIPIIKSKCYPWKSDKLKDKDIEKWLHELQESQLIFLYEYENKRYLKLSKWEKHQQVRANKSKYPTPDIEGVQLISIDINGNQSQSNVTVSESVIDNSNRDKIIDNIPFSEIINYLNLKTSSKFKETTKNTKDSIKARWNEGFTLEDFKKVIDNKTDEWVNDPKMCKYLRPETLFGTKFESYLNQHIGGGQAGSNTGENTKAKKYDTSKWVTQPNSDSDLPD